MNRRIAPIQVWIVLALAVGYPALIAAPVVALYAYHRAHPVKHIKERPVYVTAE